MRHALQDRRADAWFSVAEIEVSRNCNRRCSYCPQAFDAYRGPEVRMERSLFEHVLVQIAAIGFTGRLGFHMYNEPLLRKDLADLVAFARNQVPLAYLVLYTNGDLLDDRRYAALLESGIDHFLVSRHDGGDFPIRPYQVIQRPGDFMLSGRGGAIDRRDSPWDLPCYAPSEMLMVRYTGEVVLCHEDAQRRHIMGDLRRQSLSEVWLSDRFRAARQALELGRRGDAETICHACDNRLHPLPDTAI